MSAAYKRSEEIKLGERVVVDGNWSAVVDYKPGRRRYDAVKAKHRDTRVLIVEAPEGLREITFWTDEQISVRPPVQ